MSDVVSFERQQRLGLSESLGLDGVIIDILSWLPAKSLLRFRCVCKSWWALISDPYFIRKHLNSIDLKVTTNYSLLIKEGNFLSCETFRRRDGTFRSAECEAVLKCLSHDDPLSTRRLDFPVIDPLTEVHNISIVGSCNGLICLVLDHYNYKAMRTLKLLTFMLWNPCTGESQVLPNPPFRCRQTYLSGFGFDSTTSDYKVILVSLKSDNEFVVVFTLKSGSWRNLERLNGYVMVNFSSGCLANEALHWVLKEVGDGSLIDKKIVSFDLAEEKFHEIPFPFPPNAVEARRLFAEVGSLKNCLTLSFHTNYGEPRCTYKMWVLKNYRVKESWTEVISIPSEALDHEYTYMTCISENGEVLMQQLDKSGVLALYNPKEKKFRTLMDFRGYWYGTAMYIETLVSPFTGSTGAAV